jgi:hypothetical protein
MKYQKIDFNLIYWEGMDKVIKSFPEMFCVWITKQVLHFNGTNCQLSCIDHTGTVKNICPSCGCRDKSPGHIPCCWDPGHTLVFHDSIGSIVQWMEDQKTGPNLVAVIRSYLLAQGTKSAVSLFCLESSLQMVAQFQDRLGWDNFIESQKCALWVEMQAQEIHTRGLQKGAESWMRGLMRCLLKLTHCQWLYLNATVHMKFKDGLTIAQHNTILTQMEECLQNRTT